MFISGHVALGNDSCNLCRNKIARQVARKIAQCNSALSITAKIAITTTQETWQWIITVHFAHGASAVRTECQWDYFRYLKTGSAYSDVASKARVKQMQDFTQHNVTLLGVVATELRTEVVKHTQLTYCDYVRFFPAV